MFSLHPDTAIMMQDHLQRERSQQLERGRRLAEVAANAGHPRQAGRGRAVRQAVGLALVRSGEHILGAPISGSLARSSM